ncbi:HlyD family secretion protein [Phenylobacterium montanum]|uniref:Efflux RND transporter periplasmic adaptor subunit n=1 Tax=Phenylobacterium montanum TaxID=2823693 RepID=A0A975IWE2_9CAUL|nr:efflux RND transporter periplasmic adaptor subunit [Caulobacter sp. S6]QUD89745.1 efflux RND transporter periplasmic adaptor subunit [Caulobacter sp. S6]
MPQILRRPATWLVVLAVLTVVAIGGGLSLRAKAKTAQAAKQAPPPESPYAAIANGKADVEGGVIQVAARAPGVVREVDVNEGERVKKGQVLARQEDDQARLAAQTAGADLEQARAQVAAIQVQLTTAHREYDRLAKLAAANFVARQQLDQAMDAIHAAEAQGELQRAAISAAEARLAQARYNEELTIVRAPADGTIVRRYAQPGAGASTLNVSTMFDLEPDTPHIVRAEIAEAALPVVAVGQTVRMTPEADPGKTFQGQVLRRSGVFGARKLLSDDPAEAADARVVEVVISADDAPFLVGQRVLVKFLKPGKTAEAAKAGARG